MSDGFRVFILIATGFLIGLCIGDYLEIDQLKGRVAALEARSK